MSLVGRAVSSQDQDVAAYMKRVRRRGSKTTQNKVLPLVNRIRRGSEKT